MPQSEHESLTRRRFLWASLRAGGAGLALGDILRMRALGAQQGARTAETSVIQVWLGGGPSQFETFDPKPDAPREIRGPYSPIATKIPGELVCEKLPLTAAVLDKTAIVRSFTHGIDDHFGVTRWCIAGRPEPDAKAAFPSFGSIVSRFRGATQSGMPPYVLMCEDPVAHHHLFDTLGPGYLGVADSPFTVMQDGYNGEFQLDRMRKATANLELANDVTLDRIGDRKTLLAGLDRLPRQLDSRRVQEGLDPFSRAALELVTSAKARRAFDLSRESAATHERYGKHRWGQMALLSRRLVEAGVTFVTLNTAPDCMRWDWHVNVVKESRVNEGAGGPNNGMDLNGPPLDKALSALIADLTERDTCRNVLLIVWGEFGRSPRLNPNGGREHWPRLGNVLFAGQSLKVGQIIGTSGRQGEMPTSRPVSPYDVLATLYRHLGIDQTQQTLDLRGRPHPLLPEGQAIHELF